MNIIYKVKNPVAIFIYNKPDTTRKVFNQIKKLQPKTLYVVADGSKNSTEEQLVIQTRNIFENISWDCQVNKIYSDSNLGLKERFKTGLNDVFSVEESLIILEDDTLPSISFFRYCDLLLERYKDNKKIIQINGHNYISKVNSLDSYYVTRFSELWGWATWKDRWFNNYNDDFYKEWEDLKNTESFKEKFINESLYFYFKKIFDNAHSNVIDSWEFPWLYSMVKNDLYALSPSKNLVKNLGFGHPGATHTHQKLKYYSITRNRKYELKFPLKHPKQILQKDELIINEFKKRQLENSNLSKLIYIFKKFSKTLKLSR